MEAQFTELESQKEGLVEQNNRLIEDYEAALTSKGEELK